jgi:hypothetical protein
MQPPTSCESYFHGLAIMIPKWQSTRGDEYALREAVAFIMYHSKKSEFVAMTKGLVGHKYSPTLVASSQLKGGVHEGHILDALQNMILFKHDLETVQFAQLCSTKRTNLIEARIKRQAGQRAAIAVDKLSMNLKMGPGDSVGVSKESTSIDGIACKIQKAEVDDCPRPMPPFPFKDTNFEVGTEKLDLLRQVWKRSDEIAELVKMKTKQIPTQPTNDEGRPDSDNDSEHGDNSDNDNDNNNDNNSDSDNSEHGEGV